MGSSENKSKQHTIVNANRSVSEVPRYYLCQYSSLEALFTKDRRSFNSQNKLDQLKCSKTSVLIQPVQWTSKRKAEKRTELQLSILPNQPIRAWRSAQAGFSSG